MREWETQSHVKWYCRYHIVIVPKYRKKVMYGELRQRSPGFPRAARPPTRARGSAVIRMTLGRSLTALRSPNIMLDAGMV
jgi:hypothetical protein